jgi:tRNA 2-selenouridine synthase
MPTQNSSAQFHNAIYEVLKTLDPNKTLWVENESFIIGKVHMPAPLWQNMQKAKVIAYQIPLEERVKLIIAAYGQFPKSQLIERVMKLSKRLGQEMAQVISEYIGSDQLEKAVPPLLKYYDKAYEMGRVKRSQSLYTQVDFTQFDAGLIAEELMKMGY